MTNARDRIAMKGIPREADNAHWYRTISSGIKDDSFD
jgi:hypothetical protein